MRKKAQIYADKKAEEERKKVELEIKDLENQNKEQQKALEKSQEKELEIRKKSRELEEKQKNFDLEMARKLDVEKLKIEKKAKEDSDEELRKKLSEKDQKLEQLKKALDEAKRKSDQGSQQLQGDAQENDLKKALESTFPFDKIEDVPTGIRGADLIHTINNNFGQKKGVILWESKNTKAWHNDWIKKLKDDQVETKADLCILATTTLPQDVQNFAYKDGVWVVEYRFALSLVHTLRFHLLEISKIQTSLEGRDEKMDFLYQYLSGPQFKNRIENIVSAFTSMHENLLKEKKAMNAIWSKREKEIDRMMNNTTGLYGDMQGIISLPTIQNLELPGGEEDINKPNQSLF